MTGILELTRQRHGFLRLGGLRTRDDDVYVSASQVRRCELRPGDESRAPPASRAAGSATRALVHVDKVNGERAPGGGAYGLRLAHPGPTVAPDRASRRRRPTGAVRESSLPARLRPARVLVRAAPRPERTALLRELGPGSAAGEARLIVLLIDERPEEVPAWQEVLSDAELALAPADLAPSEQTRVAEPRSSEGDASRRPVATRS